VLVASGLELDRFLGELSTRRQRILTLAEPSGLRAADLLDELHQLSEQLIVAEEELRVQQEELDATQGALMSMSAERDLLLQHSTKAFVVTDEHGVVLQSTRAAQHLVRQPAARVVPRPIASWFEVADRRTVRSMISRATTGAGPERAEGVHLHASDGEQVCVDVVVTGVVGTDDGLPLLRWELMPSTTRLRAVPAPAEPAQADTPPVLRLAATAIELAGCRTPDDVVAVVAAAAVRLVSGASHAHLVLDGADPRPEPAHGHRQVGSEVAVPLTLGTRRLGELIVHADDPGALGPDAEVMVSALGTQAALALQRLTEVMNLQRATDARQLVGQAVGILVERHRITSEAAFALLATWSQHGNVKLRTLARTLVETGQEPSPLTRP
jgi:PAS domain-containing protein